MSTVVRYFGATVRELRESFGWTQEQLAEYAGLNRSYVGEIERGTCIASIVTLDKIAQAFNVPAGRLFGASRGDLASLISESTPSAK
ncbi:helix-turn-helix transcriptional regulator [Caballeronia sp. GAWG1-1]|uniref:helix-turn-helix domain-containing protein n=1 Tax=Caballeronia sp. GAWG1-1 TaxID=2921742 RepID=UPI00202907CA|nr:helix-turn-helix transcriptional regulator [Caballeronia sp. GAWG1-1]